MELEARGLTTCIPDVPVTCPVTSTATLGVSTQVGVASSASSRRYCHTFRKLLQGKMIHEGL